MINYWIKFLNGKNYYGYDKPFHVLISALLVIIFYRWFDLITASSLVFALGLIKEVFDKFFQQENFDFKDLFADLGGVILGIIVVILVVN